MPEPRLGALATVRAAPPLAPVDGRLAGTSGAGMDGIRDAAGEVRETDSEKKNSRQEMHVKDQMASRHL